MSVDTAGLGNKLNKRPKLASVKSKASKQRNKRSASDDETKPQKKETGGSGKTMVLDRKKRMVCANQGGDEQLASSISLKATKRTSSFKIKQPKLKAGFIEDSNIDETSRTMWTASKNKRGVSSGVKTAKEAAKAARIVLKTKSSDGDEKHVAGKKSNKTRFDSDKQMDQSRNRRSDVKRALSDKRISDNALESQDDQPKKRKRIRIDPHDISNKRLDDDAVLHGSKETKKVEETSVGMSKNAQFRAIQPSPSILSYVEENLLGRRRSIELKKAGYNTELSSPLDNIPSSSSTERERIEESIFRNKLTFFAAAKVSSSFPPPDVPEIAFAGRSNVGKSALLNALTRQWGVARTSDKPGLTQTINFFSLGPKIRLVDLPGYGFAYAKDEVKEAWEELVKEYVSTRAGLSRVCLLIDSKWGIKPRDHELINLMERFNKKYQIVLTKTDMVFPMDVARRAMQIEENLKANKSVVQPVMMASSKTGAGIRSLRTVLAKIARFAKV